MRSDLWLLSVIKWSYLLWAIEMESESDVRFAMENFKCGYCKNNAETAYDCGPCALFKQGLCATKYNDAYHVATSTDMDGNPLRKPWNWYQRKRAAKKMWRAIMADAPRGYK